MSWTEEQTDREQLKHVSDANLIEEGGHSVLVRRSILFICIMLLIFVVWAMITQVDEVAVSFGEIQPVADMQSIQHLEGGIVSKVLIKEGQEVRAGDTLILLSSEAVNAELQKAEARGISLNLDAERLRAFVRQTPDYQVDWLKKVNESEYQKGNTGNQANVAALIKEDVTFLSQQNKDRESQRKILSEQVAQKKSQIGELSTNITELEKQLALYVKEENMFKELAPKGYISQRDYIIAQRKTAESEAQIKQMQSKLVEAESAYKESQDQLTKLDTTLNKEALKELNDINTQLLDVQHTIQRLRDSFKRLTVISPITGVVKGLKATSGSVLTPGEVIMEIVPTEGEMHVDCRISTHDIGYIKVDNPAQVKVMTFDYARYGSIKGKVVDISANTFLNKDNLPYYRAFVSLEKNYVGTHPEKNRLKPGMTVQVDIITGRKSVMDYLLKPITRALDESFRER
ncbi:MAG: hypothetical protein A3I77_08415 [Gammaproteobacteria bacterium RIFCSPLOWO2_02_FULL_42_14]|nr:MAG: hypothetical protein A3B71_07040 [Gammaproteobacteria bacterium RIFCSPHIGHO2_02_FULL_42_43]OGT27873.1 MAG: hypothetical protein A2624_00685 [Gammaproteobacteria bacterium RIFCSPHIGHO2_01_FULL_42_8]OGT53598.1 MAG: hypothetical protein A3E54_02620 [Gammaproteobacteria bacterium RIFCSPHIGHO2_12_FULL_41_25]OGT61649.1 MAG: hypothetical protein A3I77_08415 [Gammaproteobacteria bacterium RIFCSPLOWO2_02_FULL_42_14]OGT85408.1 MAG: hypothetical protein A3G86_08125 [Gammaproteobacteria bacterium R